MFKAITNWMRHRKAQPGNNHSDSRANIVVENSEPTDSQLVPYDENLLERSRTQWQFGDWQSLASLQRDTLRHHPDRAKLALLSAAGHQQLGNMSAARQLTRLAQDWGCSKKLISQILIAGAHLTLGRAAAAGGDLQCALQHFQKSITTVSPTNDPDQLVKARYALDPIMNLIKDSHQPQLTTKSPYISIVIPFYNAEKYVETCIATLLAQSFKGFEALLIDDGSSDSSLKLIEKLTSKDPRFRIIKKHINQGVAAARNLGITEARGDFIRFMDVDDTLPAESLKLLSDYSSQQDFVRGSTEVFQNERKHTDFSTTENLVDIHPFIVPMPARSKIIYGHCSMLFNRQFLNKNNIRFPEHKENAEDTTFLADCFFRATRISVIKDIVYQYRRHEDSLSNPVNPGASFFINSLGRWFYIKQRAIESGHPNVLDQAFENAMKNYISKEYLPRLSKHLTNIEIQEIKGIVNALTNIFGVPFSQYSQFFEQE
jgi:glycosyltransferase involved in cell wall biosynthesis